MVDVREIREKIIYQSCPLCGYEYGPEGGWRWKMMVEPRLNKVVYNPEKRLLGTGFTVCPRCSLVHQISYPEPETLRRIYATPLYSMTIGTPSLEKRQSASYNEAWRAHHLVNIDNGTGLLQNYVKDTNSILDVGCAKLLLMKSMEYWYGPELISGVDLSMTSQQLGKAFNFSIWSDITDIPEDQQYDLITHIHTFEHIIFPKEHLLNLREHLSPNGLLFMMVPNVFSHPSLNFFHIFGYSTTTLRWMLESCGFVVDIIYTLPAMWMRWYPQDILCVARKSDHPIRAFNFKPDKLFFTKIKLGMIGMNIMRTLPEWIREPRPPKLVAPVFIIGE